MSRIARVFPRYTKATPRDSLAWSLRRDKRGEPIWDTAAPPFPEILAEELGIDEVHVSVTFTYDLPIAERLAKEWKDVGVPVKMGGPATGEPGGEFVPGMYLRHGYVITSRGCPNRCWFCSVPKREGGLRELPITEGWNVLDDNLLACSESHIRAVFGMLARQPRRPEFTGGLEAKILRPWHCDLLRQAKTRRMYFAYDTPDDHEPLVEAGRMLRTAGITTDSHAAACYVLIGYTGDTFDRAENRLTQAMVAGFVPYAMLYRDERGDVDLDWGRFQRVWLRPQIVGAKMRDIVLAGGEKEGES